MSELIINSRGDTKSGKPSGRIKVYKVQALMKTPSAAKLFGFDQWIDVSSPITALGIRTDTFETLEHAKAALRANRQDEKINDHKFRVVAYYLDTLPRQRINVVRI